MPHFKSDITHCLKYILISKLHDILEIDSTATLNCLSLYWYTFSCFMLDTLVQEWAWSLGRHEKQ